MSDLERLEFWLRHVRQVQACDWDRLDHNHETSSRRLLPA